MNPSSVYLGIDIAKDTLEVAGPGRRIAAEGLIFGETEGVVGLRQPAAAVLRALPELTAVLSEKERLVLLRLVPEEGP